MNERPPEVLPPGYAEVPRRDGPAHRRSRPPRGFDRPPRGLDRAPRRIGRTILLVAAILLAALLILAGVVFIWANSQINPGGRQGAAVTVDIPSGASTSRIASILAKAKVIHNADLFTLYAEVEGKKDLLPGRYRLATNESYGSVIGTLQVGPTLITDRLTIPEGFTIRQIAAAVAALPGLHLSASAFLAASTSGEVRSPYEPAGVNNLEGLLFPATYQVRQGDTEVKVLEEMVQAFTDQVQQLGLVSAANHLGETVYQLATVASIVEREAKLDGDRANVASVIYNRLHRGIPLGADSTETYYLRLTDPTLDPTATQLNTPGPYNTRINKGLPPTPIANPGIPSLQAAAKPAATPYLYFVEVNPDGQLGFASTSSGFAALQGQCQAAKLC